MAFSINLSQSIASKNDCKDDNVRLSLILSLQSSTNSFNHLLFPIVILITNIYHMLRLTLRRSFSSVKQQYSRHFILKLNFGPDGYYHSNQFRPEFINALNKLQKENKAIVLGGDSFPFGTSTFYFNCDDIETAQQFMRNNVYVRKRVATATLEESERISEYKIGNVANFYQIKLDM